MAQEIVPRSQPEVAVRDSADSVPVGHQDHTIRCVREPLQTVFWECPKE